MDDASFLTDHAVQLLKGKCPSAKLSYVIEPWFMGGGEFVPSRVPRFLDFVPR
jgi:hypothetical protein